MQSFPPHFIHSLHFVHKRGIRLVLSVKTLVVHKKKNTRKLKARVNKDRTTCAHILGVSIGLLLLF